MRTSIALLIAAVLLLAACGDDSTPVTTGPGDDTETTDSAAPPETTDGPQEIDPDPEPIDEAPAPDVDTEPEPIDTDGDESLPSGEQLEAELAQARERWAALDVQSYTMEQSVVAQLIDAVGPFTVTVTDGVVAEVAYAPDALVEGGSPPADVGVATIDEIFDVIDDAIGEADEVRVIYDPDTGVPTDVWIDESFQLADEERGYTVVVDLEG